MPIARLLATRVADDGHHAACFDGHHQARSVTPGGSIPGHAAVEEREERAERPGGLVEPRDVAGAWDDDEPSTVGEA